MRCELFAVVAVCSGSVRNHVFVCLVSSEFRDAANTGIRVLYAVSDDWPISTLAAFTAENVKRRCGVCMSVCSVSENPHGRNGRVAAMGIAAGKTQPAASVYVSSLLSQGRCTCCGNQEVSEEIWQRVA